MSPFDPLCGPLRRNKACRWGQIIRLDLFPVAFLDGQRMGVGTKDLSIVPWDIFPNKKGWGGDKIICLCPRVHFSMEKGWGWEQNNSPFVTGCIFRKKMGWGQHTFLLSPVTFLKGSKLMGAIHFPFVPGCIFRRKKMGWGQTFSFVPCDIPQGNKAGGDNSFPFCPRVHFSREKGWGGDKHVPFVPGDISQRAKGVGGDKAISET